MAVTNGPSKEYLEQMKAIGKQAEAAAAQAAAARMQGSQAQKAQAVMAASMAQRTTGANKTQQAAAAAAPYSYKPGDPMAGVSAGTRAQLDKYQAGYTPSAAVLDAQNAMAGIQGQKPGAYTPSEAVIQAQNMLAQIQNNKPQGYNSKYAPQLEQILAEIQNPQDFKWDFNGDELFKSYADTYSRKGQQAMMNAIGNASALTGGYGNSYATQVGQQTYDEYMNDLMGVGMDLRDRAYQVYRDKQGDLLNRYNVLQNADQIDYGRYRDTVGDWQNELGYWTNQANAERNFDYGQHRDQVADWQTMLDYWTGRADSERNFDYGTYADMMNYWTNMANAENQDYWNFENLEWDKLSTAQKLAMDNVATMLQLGIAPSMETLLKAGYSAADAQAIMAALAGAVAGGSGGGYGGGGGGSSSGGSGGGNPNTLLNIANGGAQAVNGMADFAQDFFDAFTKPTPQGTLKNIAKDTSFPWIDYVISPKVREATQDLINDRVHGKQSTSTVPTGSSIFQVPHGTTTPAPVVAQPGVSQSPLDILQNNTTWIPASAPTKKEDEKKNRKNGGNGQTVTYKSK